MAHLKGKSLLICVVYLSMGFTSMANGQTIRRDEYRIYAWMLRDAYREVYREELKRSSKKPILILLSRTDASSFFEQDGITPLKEDRKMPALYRSFNDKNKHPAVVEKRFHLSFPVVMAERSEMEALIKKGELETAMKIFEEKVAGKPSHGGPCGPGTWQYVFARFPNTKAIFQLSRVGYSSNGKFALADITAKNDDASWGFTYWFVKAKNGWVVDHASGSFGSC